MSLIKITVLWLAVSTTVLASSIPLGCVPLKMAGETLALALKKPSLILMQNTSENTVWLTHPVADPGASAGWTSQIQSGKWSALALREKNFSFTCTESRPGHEQQIACAEAIMACVWKKAKIPAEEKGSFWAAEDKSLSELKAALSARAFTLGSHSN